MVNISVIVGMLQCCTDEEIMQFMDIAKNILSERTNAQEKHSIKNKKH